jgi:hypothetical protein
VEPTDFLCVCKLWIEIRKTCSELSSAAKRKKVWKGGGGRLVLAGERRGQCLTSGEGIDGTANLQSRRAVDSFSRDRQVQ